MGADGVTSSPERSARSPGGGPVPAEALADERFLLRSSGNMVYNCAHGSPV